MTFLYYGAYESFAPTHDSSTATLSYSQSTAWRSSRQTLRNWEKKRLPSLPQLPVASAPRPSLDAALSSIDPALFSEQDGSSSTDLPSQEEAKLILRAMEDNQVVEQRLKENTELLRILQEAQFEKLRRVNVPGSGEAQPLSRIEQAAAKRLQTSLTSLLNARPRSEEPVSGIIPASSRDIYKSLKQAIVQPETPIYRGTLDVNNSKSIRDRFMSGKRDGSGAMAVDVKPNVGRGKKTVSPKKEKASVPPS